MWVTPLHHPFYFRFLSINPYFTMLDANVPRDFENQILMAGQLAALEILEQVAAGGMENQRN